MGSREAFTIIEVIFVIVIISILAVVLIPKLSATRDDAKIAVALNSIGTLINDLSTYYNTKDTFNSNLSNMTYVDDINFSTPWSSITGSGVITYYTPNNSGAVEACIEFLIQNRDGNLTISSVSNPSGNICKGLQSVDSYQNLLGTKLVGGNRIKF